MIVGQINTYIVYISHKYRYSINAVSHKLLHSIEDVLSKLLIDSPISYLNGDHDDVFTVYIEKVLLV